MNFQSDSICCLRKIVCRQIYSAARIRPNHLDFVYTTYSPASSRHCVSVAPYLFFLFRLGASGLTAAVVRTAAVVVVVVGPPFQVSFTTTSIVAQAPTPRQSRRLLASSAHTSHLKQRRPTALRRFSSVKTVGAPERRTPHLHVGRRRDSPRERVLQSVIVSLCQAPLNPCTKDKDALASTLP